MKIGFATPVSLDLLRDLVEGGDKMPRGYVFGPAASWIRELIRCGHYVVVYTTASDIEVAQTYWGRNITIRIAKSRSRSAGRNFWATERKQLKQMMLEDRCDVIHAHWTYEFALAALATGIPTLVTIHDLPWRVLAYFRDPHRLARLLMAYVVAFKGRRFTAVSQDAANHFRRFLNPFARITVIPNGLPDSIFETDTTEQVSRISECVFATILQGWSQRKNPITALKAFHLVLQNVPDARLLMFGYDYQPDGPAQQWANAEGIDKNVTFVGLLPYDELLKQVRTQVDVIVHPSMDEAFSMAALESMALRKAVIAGKFTPGMSDMFDGGRCGILVDVTSPPEVASAMTRLAMDRSFCTGIACVAYDRANSLYRVDAVMRRYQALYKGA
jgi:glycosyltransferase involved in cell wall biosynthesis